MYTDSIQSLMLSKGLTTKQMPLSRFIKACFHTNSKQLDARLPKALGWRDDVILGLAVRDQNTDFGNTFSGARLRLEAVLLNIHQRKACENTPEHSTAKRDI